MHISSHAGARSRQRGIPQKFIDTIMEAGTPIKKPGGAVEYLLRKKDKIKLQEELKKLIQNLDKAEGDAVLTIDDEIVTVYHHE